MRLQISVHTSHSHWPLIHMSRNSVCVSVKSPSFLSEDFYFFRFLRPCYFKTIYEINGSLSLLLYCLSVYIEIQKEKFRVTSGGWPFSWIKLFMYTIPRIHQNKTFPITFQQIVLWGTWPFKEHTIGWNNPRNHKSDC